MIIPSRYFKLRLTDADKCDLIDFLKSLSHAVL